MCPQQASEGVDVKAGLLCSYKSTWLHYIVAFV